MKFRHLLPVLALCSPLASLAVPAYPGLIKQSNPDGSIVEIRLFGDEYFSYATDAQGKWIMECDDNGFWNVAVRAGQRLAATAGNIEMLQNIEEANFSRAAIEPIGKYAELGDDGRSKFPCTGSGQYLIVLLQYSDTKFSMTDPQAYYNNWFNQENFVDGDIRLSARDYYKKVSNGLFNPNFVVSPVVTLPYSSAYYVGSGGKYTNFRAGAMWALRELVKAGFDFNRFDLDNDGVIDNVYFIYAGYGQADTGDKTTIWPHASSLSGIYGNKSGGRYACSNELRGSHKHLNDKTKTGIGTFCHEFGHVLGLPDLYDPNYDPKCDAIIPGDWSIMCNGSYLGDGCVPASYAAYDRWACRWLEYTDLQDGSSHSLVPLTSEAKAYRLTVPTTNGKSEYFVFENRTKQDIDTYIPNSGLLIWHVDYDYAVWRSNRVNSTATHPRCTIMPPTGKSISSGQWPAGGAYGTLLSNGLPNSFNTFNTVASGWTPTVYDIAYDAATSTATFKYAAKADAYDKVPDVWVGKVDGMVGFRANWPKVEGAKGYVVNVTRRNSSGSLFNVDNYNDKMVEDNDIAINESSAMMAQEHQIRVRVLGPMMPSSKEFVSEWIRPNEMNAYDPSHSAVGTLFDDASEDVYVENGNIIAPAYAKVYNMGGIQTGTENLPAGIYIVRLNNKVVKVVVR